MAEDLTINTADKSTRYASLIPQLHALCEGEENVIANLSNIAAGLKEALGFFWVGFYLVDRQNNELVLGPFQGPVACTRIQLGKGVCGSSWKTEQTLLVPDVEQFPGHIACSSASRSEIVIPIFSDKQVVAILDVDSEQLNDFDHTDQKALEKLCAWIGEKLF